VARERFVDVLIERGVVAGGVGVPDFIVARISRLAQCLDLAKGDFRERQCALVFVTVDGHCKRPKRDQTPRAPLPTTAVQTVTDSREREVNTPTRWACASERFATRGRIQHS